MDIGSITFGNPRFTEYDEIRRKIDSEMDSFKNKLIIDDCSPSLANVLNYIAELETSKTIAWNVVDSLEFQLAKLQEKLDGIGKDRRGNQKDRKKVCRKEQNRRGKS